MITPLPYLYMYTYTYDCCYNAARLFLKSSRPSGVRSLMREGYRAHPAGRVRTATKP